MLRLILKYFCRAFTNTMVQINNDLGLLKLRLKTVKYLVCNFNSRYTVYVCVVSSSCLFLKFISHLAKYFPMNVNIIFLFLVILITVITVTVIFFVIIANTIFGDLFAFSCVMHITDSICTRVSSFYRILKYFFPLKLKSYRHIDFIIIIYII